jgi:hypothetical protein
MTPKRSWIAFFTGLTLLGSSAALQAREESLEITMPWGGQGTIYHIDTDKRLFMGAFEGIMYIKTDKGELDAAFADCPSVMHIDVKSKATSATGYCTITPSKGDAVFAEWSCKGEVGICKGIFEITGGTGQMEGITGSSEIKIRSVIGPLLLGMADGSTLRAASGLIVLPKLTYRVPDKKK